MAGELRTDGKELRRRMIVAGCATLNAWGDHVLGEAQLIVPLDEGPLSESGYVEEAIPGRRHRMRVRFTKVYAAAQHEGFALQRRGGRTVEWRVHKYSKPGRGKKYLETPFKAAIPELAPAIAAANRAVLRVSR
jgi:hypothetical protein